MACSDNVVRAGLTPKLIDVPTLCEMLVYQCPDNDKVEDTFKFKPKVGGPNDVVFDAPVPDFSVAKLKAEKEKRVSFPTRSSASIVIVTECGPNGSYNALNEKGSTYVKDGKVKNGLVLFLEAKDTLEMTSDDQEDIEAFQAFC